MVSFALVSSGGVSLLDLRISRELSVRVFGFLLVTMLDHPTPSHGMPQWKGFHPTAHASKCQVGAWTASSLIDPYLLSTYCVSGLVWDPGDTLWSQSQHSPKGSCCYSQDWEGKRGRRGGPESQWGQHRPPGDGAAWLRSEANRN